MLFGWPDLYDVTYESTGVGNYCLMAYQGPSATIPVLPNPHFRSIAGWETADPDSVHRLAGHLHPCGQFPFPLPLQQPRRGKRVLPHREQTLGGPQRRAPRRGTAHLAYRYLRQQQQQRHDPRQPLLVSVEQADGLSSLSATWATAATGTCSMPVTATEFADWTLPDSKWWTGSQSGLNIVNIGPWERTQSFTVQSGEYQTANIGNPGMVGTVNRIRRHPHPGRRRRRHLGNGGSILLPLLASLRGDGEIIARIQSLENTNPWAKAGVMIRESIEPGSRNVFMASPPEWHHLPEPHLVQRKHRQQRNSRNRPALVETGAPRQRFQRLPSANGVDLDRLRFRHRAHGRNRPGRTAVTSHANTTLATAVVTDYKIVPSPWTRVPSVRRPCPAPIPWTTAAGGVTRKAGGADFWGVSDQFHYLQQGFSGEGRIVARLNSLVNTDPWAKAGVMFRSSRTRTPPMFSRVWPPPTVPPFQRRTADGAGSPPPTPRRAWPPRAGSSWKHATACSIRSQSANGTAWTEVGRESREPSRAPSSAWPSLPTMPAN